VLLGITPVLGLLTALGVATGLEPAELTFAALADPVQLTMSVAVPAFGIVLAHDLRLAHATERLLPTLLGAAVLAAFVGAVGVLICAATLAIAGTGPDPWRHAGTIAVGSVLVQVCAVLVGTGLGLLLRSRVVAFLLTFVPLGLWLLLGAVDAMEPARAWLSPYATARNLLSGNVSALEWVQWFVVFLLWGVGLNAAGARASVGLGPEGAR
jgi:hypothetical protein